MKLVNSHFKTTKSIKSKLVIVNISTAYLSLLISKLSAYFIKLITVTRKIRKIGFYVKIPPFRNGRMEELHLQI